MLEKRDATLQDAVIVIDFTLASIGVTPFEGLNIVGLLALPLFILTGDLVNVALRAESLRR